MSNQSVQVTEEPLQCQNCGSELHEHYEFCPNCGQKTNEELTIGVLFYNTISNYFSFDARFLKSFFPLLLRPGYLARKFLEGKRLMYLHPAQMYLFISVIFFFIISFSTRELVQEADKLNKKVMTSDPSIVMPIDSLVLENEKAKALDSAKIEDIMKPLKDNQKILGLKDADLKMADSLLKAESSKDKNVETSFDFNKEKVDSLVAAGADKEIIYKEMGMSEDPSFIERRFFSRMLNLVEGRGAGPVIQAFFDSIPISMFFLLPFFALILKLFYYKKGKYVHHLVFSFYFFSFLFSVFSILFAVNKFIYDIPDWIDWLVAISTYFYFFIALKRFYEQHWFYTWLKSGFISFVFILLVIPTTGLLMLAFSFLTSQA